MQQANTRPCSFRHSLNSAFKFTSCLPAWTQTPVPFGKQTPSAVAEEVGDCEVCSRICNGVFKVSASIPFSKAVSSNSTSGPGMHNDAVQFHADYRASTLPTTLGKVSAIAEHHRHPFLAAPNPAVQVNPGSKQEKPDQMWLHSRSRFVNPVATAPVACSIVSSSPAATEATTSGNWQCDVCGKRFALSSVLKSHRHIHSGVRPHVCEICKKHFLRSGDLKKHRRFDIVIGSSTSTIRLVHLAYACIKVPHR